MAKAGQIAEISLYALAVVTEQKARHDRIGCRNGSVGKRHAHRKRRFSLAGRLR
jgi:hypothetical protein